MKKIEMFTDGACSGNPGPGGWGTILRYNGIEKELSGGEADTTNNRMELTAVIEGLKALKEPCEVTVCTDSKYVSDAVTLGWAKNWKKKGGDVKNPDLWEKLLKLVELHDITYVWVKGHAGNKYNEICDTLAVEAAKKASL